MTLHLKDLILALYECATTTTEQEIRTRVKDALRTMGRTQPEVFLESTHLYLLQNSKLSASNRAYILQAIATVLESSAVVAKLDEQQSLLTINLAIQEMIMAKEENKEWSDAGRHVLMVVAKHDRLVNSVLDGLLQKFPPGVSTPPPKSVIQTLASIAQCNATGFVPFLTDILSRTTSLLSHVKVESVRSVWATSIASFCEAIAEISSSESTNNAKTHDDMSQFLPRVSEQLRKDYCDQMELILDSVMPWLNAKDPKCRADAFECVGSLMMLVSQERVTKDLKKVVTVFLTQYKKGTLDDQFAMTKGMFNFLLRSCTDDSTPIEFYLDDICNSLFQHVAVHNDQLDDGKSAPSPTIMRLRNEVCRCFLAASLRFADKLVYYLLHKMQSVQDATKLGAIDLIRHLLNSAEAHMEDKRSLIVMGLKPLLCDDSLSVRVKSSMCQLCVALADHGYVHIDSGGSNVILFLTTNLIAELEPVGKKGTAPTSTPSELSQLRSQSAQALCTIAKTCDSAQQLLWPNLLEFICAENYSPVATELFKVLKILVKKMREKEDEINFLFGPDVNPKVAGAHQVLVRLITCMNIAPMSSSTIGRAREAIKLLQCLGVAIQPSLGVVFKKELPELLTHLDGLIAPSEAQSPARSSRLSSPEPVSPVDVKKAKVERFQALLVNGLLKEVLAASCTSEWLEGLASAQGKQIPIYNKYPHDKAFVAQCLGFTLSKITNANFVKEHLVLLFRAMNHTNAVERRGCAAAVGNVARFHTTLMLTELENIAKWEHSKKSNGGLFGFIKEAYHRGTDTQVIFLRATIVLAYGYLVTVSPTDFLPQRLEQTVLPFLRQYMVECKADVVVKEAHLETIHMIALAVERLTNDYRFESRFEMLSYVKDYVMQEQPEMLSTWIRLYACRAATSLVRLEPSLSDNELWDLASVLSRFTLTICREKPGLKTIDDDESSTIMDATVTEYRSAIAEMIRRRPVVDTVVQMLKIFVPYYGSSADYERLRSIEVTVLMLKLYLRYASDIKVGHASDFSPLGGLLARLAPRIVDSLLQIRHSALKAIWLSFQLSFLHKGQISRPRSDSDDIRPIDDLQPPLFDLEDFANLHIGSDSQFDVNKGRAAMTAIANEIEAHLPQSQLQIYLSTLFKMLSDKQNNVSSAAAQLLSTVFRDRGQLLHSEAEIVVSTILENLPAVHAIVQSYTNLLDALTHFAEHQLYTVVKVLLKQPIPHSAAVADSWMKLVKDSAQFALATDQILELTTCHAVNDTDTSASDVEKRHAATSAHFETVDLSGGCIVRLVNPKLCANFAALHELVLYLEDLEPLHTRIPQLLFTIFHNLVAVVEAQYPTGANASTSDASNAAPADAAGRKKKEPVIITSELRRVTSSPAALVTDVLRTVLSKLRADAVVEAMNSERAWTHLVHIDHYVSAIGVVCRLLCDQYPAVMRELMQLSLGHCSSTCEFLRIASAAILSSLIARCPKAEEPFEFDEALLDQVMQELKQFAQDRNLLVRKLAIRGYTLIGTLASSMPNGDAIAQKYAQLAFEAALNGLDDAYDRKDEIASESMCALDSVVMVVDATFIEQILSSLLLKLRPCFEKENPCLRAVAFSLFGKLGAIVGETSVFKQSLHENIVSILLYLNDEDINVRLNCVSVLVSVSPLFSLDTLMVAVNEHLMQSRPPISYAAFLKDVGMILVLSFPDRLNFYALGCSNYFKSQFAQIRANAALLTGFLLEPLTPALRGTLSKELVFTSLVQLLRDPTPQVRSTAVRAISCLHSFS